MEPDKKKYVYTIKPVKTQVQRPPFIVTVIICLK